MNADGVRDLERVHYSNNYLLLIKKKYCQHGNQMTLFLSYVSCFIGITPYEISVLNISPVSFISMEKTILL